MDKYRLDIPRDTRAFLRYARRLGVVVEDGPKGWTLFHPLAEPRRHQMSAGHHEVGFADGKWLGALVARLAGAGADGLHGPDRTAAFAGFTAALNEETDRCLESTLAEEEAASLRRRMALEAKRAAQRTAREAERRANETRALDRATAPPQPEPAPSPEVLNFGSAGAVVLEGLSWEDILRLAVAVDDEIRRRGRS